MRSLMTLLSILITFIVVGLFAFGQASLELVVLTVLLQVIDGLRRIEDLIGQVDIEHKEIDVRYKNGVWRFRMDNHVTYTDKRAITNLMEMLDKTLNPTSETTDRIEF